MAIERDFNGTAATMLARLDERVRNIMETQARFHAETVRYRDETNERLDDLTRAITAIPSLVQTVADLKPEVEKAKEDRFFRLGVFVAGTGGLAGIGSLIKSFFYTGGPGQ